MVSFSIGGLDIPLESGGQEPSHQYGTREISNVLPLADGGSLKQTVANTEKKLTVRVESTNRWAATGLSNLNYSQPLQIRCVSPRAVMEPDPEIPITPNHRTDSGAEPWGFAVVDGLLIETPVNMTGNNAQLTPVSGATAYVVNYLPQLSVWATFTERNETRAAYYSWVLECSEV